MTPESDKLHPEARERLAKALEQVGAGSHYITAIRAGATRDAMDQAALRALTATLTENDALKAAIRQALTCTPSIQDGAIVYDCGDPWELLRTALKGTQS